MTTKNGVKTFQISKEGVKAPEVKQNELPIRWMGRDRQADKAIKKPDRQRPLL